MRQTSWILTATLILSLSIPALAVGSEKDSYAERSHEWVDLVEIERLIEEQMEAVRPLIEYEIQPLVEVELERLMEELVPLMEGIRFEVQESLSESMVDVRKVVRESLRGLDYDGARGRVDLYESRQDRIHEEIELLEERLQDLRERLEEIDDRL